MKIKQAYRYICNKFTNAHIDSPELEARFLLCGILELSDTDFFLDADKEIPDEGFKKIEACCIRRLKGEPLQYIIEKWDFMGRTFRIGKGVLIPRPETEQLCEKIIELLKNKNNAVVYDLCSGSGCIGVTLKAECPDIKLFLVEKSDEAIEYLKYNAAAILNSDHCTIIKGDVLDVAAFETYPQADVIVSNPPYIKSSEVPFLQKEVTFEPAMALDGGEDGLDFYRYIISAWSKKLKPDGEIFFEIGEEQGTALCDLFKNIGFDSRVIKDYNYLDRIVRGRKMSYDI